MRFTMFGGFFSALSDVISVGVMELSAASAAWSAGWASSRSRSASCLTAAMSCACRGHRYWSVDSTPLVLGRGHQSAGVPFVNRIC